MSLIGKSIGKIRIVEQFGEGGMGQIFKGYDEKLEREVAVKALKVDWRLSKEFKARFLREAKLLSQLEHPNICRVYDFVEDGDNHFLVMELIRGKNLDTYLDQLSDSEKLEIARQISGVLVETHSRNIIHRDLKPSNVMLTHKKQVKVLDFGLARSIGEPDIEQDGELPKITSDEKTGHFLTKRGLVIGTPRFMSPEQARGEQTSGASDMYSFGLLLQWLFTGKSPYGKDSKDILASVMKGDTLPASVLDPDLLQLINRLKSMIPENRPTALDTLERISWIKEKPKRRVKKVAIGAFVILLVIGTLLSLFGFIQAKKSENRAIESESRAIKEAENARQTIKLLQEFVSSVDPGKKGKDLKVIELVQAFKPNLEELDHKPEIQVVLFDTYGKTYHGLGFYKESFSYYKRALELRRSMLKDDHPDIIRSMNSLAYSYNTLGKYENAEHLYRQALGKSKVLLGSEHSITLDALDGLATSLGQMGKYTDNKEKSEEAWLLSFQIMEVRRRTLGEGHPETVQSMNNYANALSDQKKYVEAVQLHRQVMSIRKEKLGEGHPKTLNSMNNIGVNLLKQKKYREATQIFRKCTEVQKQTLGEKHRDTVMSLYNLACIESLQGHREEAMAYLSDAVNSGWNNIWIAKDPDLKPLRNDTRFKVLVERVRKKQMKSK